MFIYNDIILSIITIFLVVVLFVRQVFPRVMQNVYFVPQFNGRSQYLAGIMAVLALIAAIVAAIYELLSRDDNDDDGGVPQDDNYYYAKSFYFNFCFFAFVFLFIEPRDQYCIRTGSCNNDHAVDDLQILMGYGPPAW
jgi:hypothetical protein